MSVLDEVLCTGHGVGDVVPVLHYLEEKRTYTFAKPAECGSPNTNNVYALYILPSQIGHNFAWCHRSPADDNYAIVATQNVNHTSGHAVEYLTRWGPGLLRLGAIMSFGGYCVSRPGLLRLGAVVG